MIRLSQKKMLKIDPKNPKILSKEGVKKLSQPFIVLFLINFFIINWNDASWVFNYKVISGLLSNFAATHSQINNASQSNWTDKEDSLEIPKIGVSVPLVIVEDSSKADFIRGLNEGVILFPDSALPDEAGPTIVLGHSAPESWPKTKYDWVFSQLNNLEEKDEINLYFDHQKYTYHVKRKFFLNRGEDIPNNLGNSENTLLLISCWPPGQDYKRILVESILNKS